MVNPSGGFLQKVFGPGRAAVKKPKPMMLAPRPPSTPRVKKTPYTMAHPPTSASTSASTGTSSDTAPMRKRPGGIFGRAAARKAEA